MTGTFLSTRTNDKENMEKQFRSESMSSIKIAEFESLKPLVFHGFWCFPNKQGPITVSVEGKDGFTAIDYDVWYVANASAASGSATLNITKT